jgi:predicted nucleic acid-binding protein
MKPGTVRTSIDLPRDLHRRLMRQQPARVARPGNSFSPRLDRLSLDVNVWLALLLEDHIHRPSARFWWDATDSTIAFTRFTALGVRRVLTTAGAMNGKPLSMDAAWRAYDRLFEDDRVGVGSGTSGSRNALSRIHLRSNRLTQGLGRRLAAGLRRRRPEEHW